MTDSNLAQTATSHRAERPSRHVPRDRTVWTSAPGQPPATVTITWGTDAHDTTTIDLTGELCARTVQQLQTLMDHVAVTTPADVAIDASAVTFIDSRGLSLLLALQARLAERTLRCRIVSPSRIVRRLFVILGMEDRLWGRLPPEPRTPHIRAA